MLEKDMKRFFIVVSTLVGMAIAISACNPSPTQAPTEIVEEEVIVEETEEPVEFEPMLIFELPHDDKVKSVAYSHDGTLFATGSFAKINLWNSLDGNLVNSLEPITSDVEDLAFSPDDQMIGGGFLNGQVEFYNVTNGEVSQNFNIGNNSRLAISPDGEWIATISGVKSAASLWSLSDGELVFELDPASATDGYSKWASAITFSPDGQLIAIGHWDGTVFIWRTDDGTLSTILEPETDFCSAWGLDFSADSRYLAVNGAKVDFNDMVRIWDLEDSSIAQNLEVTKGGASLNSSPVDFSPDGKLLAAGTAAGIYLWSLPDFDLINLLPIEQSDQTDWVTDLDFSPDSRHLLAGYWHGYAQLWRVQP